MNELIHLVYAWIDDKNSKKENSNTNNSNKKEILIHTSKTEAGELEWTEYLCPSKIHMN